MNLFVHVSPTACGDFSVIINVWSFRILVFDCRNLTAADNGGITASRTVGLIAKLAFTKDFKLHGDPIQSCQNSNSWNRNTSCLGL